ncbi:MAG: Gfo/Idh/MocA family oxidoreductase [Lentisphaeria bacterium]|nr:Gfo/Idh/MocA family oxidoreductase [Lentisphaeria bacterium]
METIKFAMIGVGGRGEIFYEGNHLPEKGFEIVAGADPSEKALERFREKIPGVKCVHDYREVLAMPEVDAVFIITPDFLHEEMAVAALNAGKHVYLEKPLAITIEGCNNILRAAMRNKRKLYLGHNMRFMPVIQEMKRMIDEGMIGEVQCAWERHFINYGGDAYFHDWHSEQKYSTGLLLQKGAHDIDILHWLMGSYTTKVVGMGMLSVYDKCGRRPAEDKEPYDVRSNWMKLRYPPEKIDDFATNIDIEDHNMILMQLANGKQVSYMHCHYTPDSDRNFCFIGTRGRIENHGVGRDAQILYWNKRQGNTLLPDQVFTVRGLEGTHGGADPLIMENFREYIRGKQKPLTSPVDAMRAVLVGICAHEAMRTDLNCRTIPEIDADILEYFKQEM